MSGVGITGKIVPLNGAAFPVFEDINGEGGWRTVSDVTARDAIPDLFRKVGMVVVLASTGVAYQLAGGIANANWVVFGGGGGGSGTPILQHTFFVSPDATPGASVFTTVQAAVSGVTPGTPTMIVVAPVSYSEAVSVPNGLTLQICLYEFGGEKATLTGALTWDAAAGDSLTIDGIDLPSGLVQHEHGTTAGAAALRLGNSVCAGITGTLSHAVVGLKTFGAMKDDCLISGTLTINGSVTAQNTKLTAATTTPLTLLTNCTLGGDITSPNIVLVGTAFSSGISITCTGTLGMDDYSANEARGGLSAFTGGGVVSLLSGVSLATTTLTQVDDSPVFNWSQHSALSLTLTEDAFSPSFVPPLYSQVLSLTLLNGAGGPWQFFWPGNVFLHPGNGNTARYLLPSDRNFYLLFYSKEANLYYPLGQTTNDIRDLSLTTDSPGTFDLTAALNILALSGPRNKGSFTLGDVAFTPTTGSFITSVPEANSLYEINGALTVNAHVTSGAIFLNVLWTDTNGIARNTLVASVSVSGTLFGSGSATITPLMGSAITWETVVGAAIVGGTPNVQIGGSCMRLSDAINIP